MDSKIVIALIVSGAIIIIAASVGYTMQVNAMTSAFAAGFQGNINLTVTPFFMTSAIGGFLSLVGVALSFKQHKQYS
ncbi:hypothetical protein [Thalassotalea euphylliae]|nr:hypothetical protein [Thalassotalea euphylliae]